MAGNTHQINIHRFHIKRNFSKPLRSISMKIYTAFTADFPDFSKRLDHPDFVVDVHDRNQNRIRANRRGADYYVSKTGLLVLTRALAAAYAGQTIRVNMVSPGQLDNSIDLPPPDEIGRFVPLGRPGTLQDIAQAVEYLLDATYVTGVNLDVAGGYRL